MKSMEYITVKINDINKPHVILAGSNLLNINNQEAIKNIENIENIVNTNICIITNETIAKIYLDQITNFFNNLKNKIYKIIHIIIPDGEQHKNQASLTYIWDKLLENKIPRSPTTLISLGGGVITDITGFAASTYQRGVDVIHIPTTLLAQIDASIGGKTAINHKLGKNMIGTFYQPKAIILDSNFLNTLPDNHFNSGMSEAIKYGLIWDNKFFKWLNKNKILIKNKDAKSLAYLIKTCAEIKANIIMQDPFDTKNLRTLLKLGHTFGHAIENISGYRTYSHGEAVSIGLLLALKYSIIEFPEKSDILKKLFTETKEFLEFFKLPTNLEKIANKHNIINDLLNSMSRDKKNVSTKISDIQLILVDDEGHSVKLPGKKELIHSVISDLLI